MHSPPLTPGHDSNSDDLNLASLDRIVAKLQVKIAKQKQEAKAGDPRQVTNFRNN